MTCVIKNKLYSIQYDKTSLRTIFDLRVPDVIYGNALRRTIESEMCYISERLG